MGWMAGVLDDPPGFPYAPPGVDVLEGGKLTSNNVAGSSHDPLQSFAVASGAVSKPGGDAAGQDALHSAGVEGSEDAGAHSKLPQPSQEEEALMCLLQHCVCVSRPCEILGDVNAEELKAVYPIHRCLVDGDGCVFSANLMMTLELCVAVQSCVYREYRSGLRTQPCGAPVLRIRGDEVLLPIQTSACQEVQDPAAQRSVQSQSLELLNQCGRHYGVKC